MIEHKSWKRRTKCLDAVRRVCRQAALTRQRVADDSQMPDRGTKAERSHNALPVDNRRRIADGLRLYGYPLAFVPWRWCIAAQLAMNCNLNRPDLT
jgi:hypothetical protein